MGFGWRIFTVLLLGLNVLMADVPVIINAGQGGNNTHNLLQRLEKDALACQPDLVIIGVGTNDALNPKNSLPLAEFEKNCTTLIQRIRAAGAEPVFLTAPPCSDLMIQERYQVKFIPPGFFSQKVEAYNAALAKICTKEGVMLVDVQALFLAKGNIGDGKSSWLQNRENGGRLDGVHPTAEGYRAMAELIAVELVKKGWQSRSPIVCLGDSITFGQGVKGAGTIEGESYPACLGGLLSQPR